MSSAMTVAATGVLPSLLLVSAALTAPLSLLLLWRYRRAVLRAMAATSGGAPAEAVTPPAAAPSADVAPLRTRLVDAASLDLQALAYRRALDSLRAATVVYVAAGLAYAAVLTSAWVVFADDDVPLTRVLWLLSCYAWPTALAVGMIAAVSLGQRLAVAGAYFGMLFAVALYGLLRNAELTFGQVAYFWLFTNAPATALLLAFLHRRVRAVGPLVLAFMVLAVTGSQVLLTAIASGDAGLRAAVAVGLFFGLDAYGILAALILTGFVLFGIIGWWLLRWIGHRYERRKMSDQSLTLDAMWLLFAIVQSITFAFQGVGYVFTGLLAFAVYKLVAHFGFALTGIARLRDAAPNLLLLRVFALGGRSERLFSALSKRWLRAGSISMIAGPDLVTATVEPHEFLDYLAGRLPRRFVRDRADFERHRQMMERDPDPDGRFRVNAFFCYADTWKDTMVALARDADAVLMDLRSFSPANQGCVFELEQLLAHVPLEQVVFLIDESTDAAFLERTLQEAWLRVAAHSPNRDLPAPEARLLRVASRGAADVRGLLQLLWTRPAMRLEAA